MKRCEICGQEAERIVFVGKISTITMCEECIAFWVKNNLIKINPTTESKIRFTDDGLLKLQAHFSDIIMKAQSNIVNVITEWGKRQGIKARGEDKK